MSVRNSVVGLTAVLLGALATWSPAADSQIRLNTIGFLPDNEKKASIAAPCSEFSVIRISDGAKAFLGKAAEPITNADTGEKIAIADFSALKEPGVYALDVPGVGRSAQFRVGGDVYNFPFYTVVRGMYLWRCGTAVSGKHNGQTFSHGPCHMEDAYLDFVGGGHVKKEGTKGWHDAGDYNKYVTNAGFTVGVMFQAWEHFEPRIAAMKLDLPESGNGTPDFLNELRWELEWLLTMQMEDGRVYHKVSAARFCGMIMPEKESAERFFVPWSSAATADFVAMMAMAARDFDKYDKAFAQRCLAAAKKSYDYLAAHAGNVRANQKGFSTGGYDANDASRRLWAAAEMWQTTGEAAYLQDFEIRAKAQQRKVDGGCQWINVKNLGMYTYILSKRPGRDAALVEAIRKDLLAAADGIVQTRNAHGYARPFGTRYFWGANGDTAQQVQTLQVANMLSPKADYTNTSLDAIGYLFGRNYYGRSFVTGLGHNPPMFPHDRRSAADGIAEPWPGYLIGGGWPKATDWRDNQESYQTNEIAINWNAAMIYALAGFVEPKPAR